MCGIVAAVAAGNIVPVLIEGLKKLEYRGYDSAGLALLAPRLARLRSVGRVSELAAQAAGWSAQLGIAHTRWATHGAPSERNAHPHLSGTLAVVHNGIIENYAELKAELTGLGYEFTSDTDTEAIAHLIQERLKSSPSLGEAVRRATQRLSGAYAIAVLREGEEALVVARHGAPLLLGLGSDGHYAASDAAALLQVTRRMIYLEDGDVAELRRDGYRIVGAGGTAVYRPVHESTLAAEAVELGEYRHYMQKEIFEQPQACLLYTS
ncbi:MAG: glutamine--fructose-6-phosphate aminotransferase, partial [Rhodocyclaceae bacterium]|nr:glutamine--fructose-6-phosphate aminotransferase [Rhodocyclaceae bacterium]